MNPNWIKPNWLAPQSICAIVTTRHGGTSHQPYDSLNLGDHVGDNPEHVRQNRRILNAYLPNEPHWLQQVHGTTVLHTHQPAQCNIADGVISRVSGQVCAILTADCLPVLFCTQDASVVGAAHAGWRGLAAGILEQTVSNMAHPPEKIIAWLGPAIGPNSFEVGDEVRQLFVQNQAHAITAFRKTRSGKWLADLYQLARLALNEIGVTQIYGGGLDTYSDPNRFYSYRRDGVTGRMASLIWIN